MVTVIKINSQADVMNASTSLARIGNTIPGWNSKVMLRWGKTLERDMKESAIMAGIKSNTGTLLNEGIQYRQRPNGRIGRLFVRQYGVFLDSMDPHVVRVIPTRTRLLAWASNARSSTISQKAADLRSRKIKDFFIFVRPHPFMLSGWRRARPKLSPMLKSHYQRNLKHI